MSPPSPPQQPKMSSVTTVSLFIMSKCDCICLCWFQWTVEAVEPRDHVSRHHGRWVYSTAVFPFIFFQSVVLEFSGSVGTKPNCHTLTWRDCQLNTAVVSVLQQRNSHNSHWECGNLKVVGGYVIQACGDLWQTSIVNHYVSACKTNLPSPAAES